MRKSGATLTIDPKGFLSSDGGVALSWLQRTISFMQIRITFDSNPSFDHVKVKTIPTRHSRKTRSRKLAQWVKINPSNSEDANNKKAGNNGVYQDHQVRQAW